MQTREKGPGKSNLDKCQPEFEVLIVNGSTQRFVVKHYKSSAANLAN